MAGLNYHNLLTVDCNAWPCPHPALAICVIKDKDGIKGKK